MATRQVFSISLLLLITILGGCIKPESKGSDKNNNSNAEGYRTVEQGDNTREYILHIPSSYDSNIPTPLVINFHGFGGSAFEFSSSIGGGYANLNSLANNQNFLVAYPQGLERSKGGAEWDPGDNGEENINDNDLYFVEQLISDVSNEFNVDQSRVYAVGYSNGGMMAYGLACSRSNLIAAVGIMSGIMLPDICNVNEYTSIIHFHGIADEVLPYEGNQDFQSISAVINFWLTQNNIPMSNLMKTQLNNGDVLRDVYSGGNENTSVVLYTINNEYDKPGGHVWFTDEIDGANPNEILWDFLSAYSLDD